VDALLLEAHVLSSAPTRQPKLMALTPHPVPIHTLVSRLGVAALHVVTVRLPPRRDALYSGAKRDSVAKCNMRA
jgi:hypothetical protein